jgi:streptogramin lyase
MSSLRRVAALTLTGLLCATGVAAAKPRISGNFAFPHGLTPGGFVQHGTVAGPGNNVWVTTESANIAKVKPALLRISQSGHISVVKIAAPGGISFTGLGLGPANTIWFSGTTEAGTRGPVNGTVTGTSAHVTLGAPGTFSWDQLAVIGGTAYLTTGFDILLSSSNGTTFTSTALENVSPFDVVAYNGGLALAGDGAIGFLGATSVGVRAAASTIVTSPAGPASSRYETVAQGKIWFLAQQESGEVSGIGSAGPDGVASVTPLAGARNITTGPDGSPWVLTSTAAERIGPSGAVTATVRLPHGQSGILIAGASKKYLWVLTLNRSSETSRAIRISV